MKRQLALCGARNKRGAGTNIVCSSTALLYAKWDVWQVRNMCMCRYYGHNDQVLRVELRVMCASAQLKNRFLTYGMGSD